MAETTHIEWTDATWNPVTGCSVVSPGCKRCYAMKLAGTRMKHHHTRVGLTIDTDAGPVWNGQVRLNETWLTLPLLWKRARRIFVCAHGDLFHESVPDAWIDRVFAVMALAPQHTFQVLTKRSARMRAYVNELVDEPSQSTARRLVLAWPGRTPTPNFIEFPLPNVWLGVSAEDQTRADERIPDLLATPATVRFLSAEPLLGAIDLTHVRHHDPAQFSFLSYSPSLNALTGKYPLLEGFDGRHPCRLDWVIAGGESGAGARPMHPDWPRQLRDQCAAADVPFFFKQWGEHAPAFVSMGAYTLHDAATREIRDGQFVDAGPPGSAFQDAIRKADSGATLPGAVRMVKCGKKAAGRLLDGVEHNAMPSVPA